MNRTNQYRTAEQVFAENIGMFFCTFSSKKNILLSSDNSVLKAVWSDPAQCSFSGKEKDSETGYYYFGARYYNPDSSLWLSVDPMSDKYPSLSPYNYCAWNPMKIVDPDGMDTIYYNLDKVKIKTIACDDNVTMLALTTGKTVDCQKSVDVRNINLSRMDALYSYSDANDIENAYYVNYNGTESETFYGDNQSCEIKGGPYMYDVHTHCKNLFKDGKIVGFGQTEPSEDKDMTKPEGRCKFGIILGYAKQSTMGSVVNFGGGQEYDPSSIRLERWIGFYDNNGRFANIRYDKFKSTVGYLQKKLQ